MHPYYILCLNYIPVHYYNKFTVNGNSIKISVHFSEIEYNERYEIAFHENGLPSGTTWSVHLNGISKTSSNSKIIFNEINGTYYYNVSSVSNYSATSSSGNFTINGNGYNLNIISTG